MTENDKSARAAEIESDLKAADAKRRADAEGTAEVMTKVLAALDGLATRLDKIEATAGEAKTADDRGPSDRESQESLGSIQARADSVSNLFGQRAFAPLSGERPDSYRRRLLTHFKQHSNDYKDLDLFPLNAQLLDIAEKRIYADAAIASANPTAPEGELIERRLAGPNGVGQRIEFYGRPSAWMNAFKQRPMRAKFIRPRD